MHFYLAKASIINNTQKTDMKKIIRICFVLVAAAIIATSCEQNGQSTFQGRWLRGDNQQVFEQIEEQFAGFSQTMWEISYRFTELYWAGRDSNWQYADYQMEHILEALEQGFIRRPEREASSAQFVNQSSPALQRTIDQEDQQAFLDQFPIFTATCNSCHAMEDVAFITVAIPQQRASNVKF
jgi:hypothetical protein